MLKPKVCKRCKTRNAFDSDFCIKCGSRLEARPWLGSIVLQENELFLRWKTAQEFFEDKTQTLGARVGKKGFLILTNQRLLFTAKLGFLAKEFGVVYGINLEEVMSVSPGRFGFNKKLVVLHKDGTHRDFVNPNILELIPEINKAIANRKQAIKAEKARERVQVVLDFTSLREVMSKGGLVMQTFKCPNCSGMLEIPESGKVLMCKYCGTPLKPIDIFEKIKSFIDLA